MLSRGNAAVYVALIKRSFNNHVNDVIYIAFYVEPENTLIRKNMEFFGWILACVNPKRLGYFTTF